MPVTLAIGNHEGGGFAVSRSDVPFYYHYFLQQLDGVTDYADPAQRTSYHHHRVSDDVLIVVLDSYIVEPVDGPQLAWLLSLLQSDAAAVRHRVAVYHAPLFPSSRPFNDWLPVLERQTWGPVFEEHGFSVNFEHHDHTLKQTYPLVGMRRNDTHGVTYLGDGSFGVASRSPNTKNAELYAVRTKTRHIWQVIFEAEQVTYTAVDNQGTILTNFSVSVQSKK